LTRGRDIVALPYVVTGGAAPAANAWDVPLPAPERQPKDRGKKIETPPSAEKVLFESGPIVVTTLRLIVGREFVPLRDIETIEAAYSFHRAVPWALGLLGVGLVLLFTPVPLVFGILACIAAAICLFFLTGSSSVTLSMYGDLRAEVAVEGKKERAQKIVATVKEAMNELRSR